MRDSCIVVFSGGQDSTTCLYWAKRYYKHIYALTFDYDQRHEIEVDAAVKIAQMAGVQHHEVLRLGPILKGRSPLTDKTAHLETYTDFAGMSATIGNRVELTFVPARNALFLTLAANRAVVMGIPDIVTGVCQADGANYPDCTQGFIVRMAEALGHGLARDITIETPLMNITKAESVRLALTLPGCFVALAYSHTAYDGRYPPTGMDHASVLRAHGFEKAGVPDPLVVRAILEGQVAVPETKNYDGRYQTALMRNIQWTEEKVNFFLSELEHQFRSDT